MAAPTHPSRIATGPVAADRGGGPSSAGNAGGGGGALKPYDRELFLAFMAAATRLFCDDEQIVLADFLAHEEKAYTERDLVDRLGWPDKRVREVCASLERLMLVQREQLNSPVAPRSSGAAAEGDAASSTAGSTTEPSRGAVPGGAALLGSAASSAAPHYYRVSPYAIVVVRYRIEQVDNGLQQQRRGAENRDAFTCPACGRQYDSLEAQRLRLDPDDAMFLCECGVKLEQEDSKAVVEQVASLQRRCQEQLQLLRSLISRCWNMRVPVFPPFTRAEKNEFKKQQDRSKQTAGSSVGSSASGGSDSQANTRSAWRTEAAAGLKVCISSGGQGGALSEGDIRPTPLWLRTGGGSVSAGSSASGSLPARLNSFACIASSAPGPPSASATAAMGGEGVPLGGPSGGPPFGGSRLPAKPRESVPSSSPGSSVAGGGARGQIKFSMKSSNKLHALRGSPAGKSAGANSKMHAAAAEADGLLLQGPTDEAQNKLGQQPSQVVVRQEDAASRAAAATAAAAESPVAGTAPTAAAGVKATQAAAASPAVPEETLRIFISRLGRDFSLEEAVEYQLEMSIEEHEVRYYHISFPYRQPKPLSATCVFAESGLFATLLCGRATQKFMELQSMYLDDL
ncbi:hypothetical protein Efla_000498 [Eimeria flavescens]